MNKNEITYKGDLLVKADGASATELVLFVELLHGVQNTFTFGTEFYARKPDNDISVPVFSKCHDNEKLKSVLDSLEELINTQLHDALPDVPELTLIFKLYLDGDVIYSDSQPFIKKEITFKEKVSEEKIVQINEALKLNKEVIYPIESDDPIELHISGPTIDENGTPYISITSPDNSILSVSVVNINTGEVQLRRILTKVKLEKIQEYNETHLLRDKFTDKNYRDECGLWLSMILNDCVMRVKNINNIIIDRILMQYRRNING